MTKHILVIDDAATVRLYHRKVLGDAGWQVDEASNGVEALEKVLNGAPSEAFDLYIVDVNMPKMDGFSFVRELRRQAQVRQSPVLMVSTEAQAHDAAAALDAGANGYLTKDSAADELVSAIRKVASGGAFLTPQLAESIALDLNGQHEALPHTRLSDRELEVLRRIAEGRRVSDIAHELHLSVKTVSTHKSRILERLQLPNMAALYRYGREKGLVTGEWLPDPSRLGD
jgi:DNA-binding NarL/FixJ family response regulator